MNARLEAVLRRVRTPEFGTAICGHRGASAVAPENTVSAFKGAIDQGCDLVELDVLLTRDEELVVFHDEKLDRTTDRKGVLAALTLEELRQCDAGCWFGEKWKGERIPHLSDALAAIDRKAVPMIELKQKSTKAPKLVPGLAKHLEAQGYADRAVAICWDDVTARAVREALPNVLIARIAFTRLGIRRAVKNKFDGVVPWRASATRRFLDEAKRAGVFVAPWTVNNPKDMLFFARNGCDVVITDRPDVLRERLQGEKTAREEQVAKEAAEKRNADAEAAQAAEDATAAKEAEDRKAEGKDADAGASGTLPPKAAAQRA